MKKRIFLSPPHMGGYEHQLVAEAFESNYIAPLGPQVDAFEQEFTEKIKIPFALALSSGTAAMHLALKGVGVKQGDDVFVSTLTFIGGVAPIGYLGARPIFIDSDRKTWNMDPDLLAEGLGFGYKNGRLPKAVVPTDLYGQSCDIDRILEICKPYNIPVIVDSAESLGALYKDRSAGSKARAAIFSFNGNKIITTSGGGMLVSHDEQLIADAKKRSQQAREPFPHYEHKEIGYNYRMSNVLAAIGRGQLKVLDERVRKRRQIFDFYYQALKNVAGIAFMPEAPYGKSSRWLTIILVDPVKFGSDCEKIHQALEQEKIEARPIWKPMHLQPVFSGTKCIGGKVAEELFQKGLCLPSGTAMTDEDLNRIVSAILNCKK
ncbi:DegT/DnrJ/EryC1/StrS family aminotransferase [Thermodesulfobacteriota bacterium]